jgi:hypothetical protein
MTYDALLALRGWGRDDFATVTADFLSAVRHALFAERVAKVLRKVEEVRDMDVPHHAPPDDVRRVMKAKYEAEAAVGPLHDALYPEDDDGR